MLQSSVALVDQTGLVPAEYLAEVAAALQIQVNRDLAKFWPVSASVNVLPNKRVAHHIWPLYLVTPSHMPAGAGGYHSVTPSKQPYSVIGLTQGWETAVSHEICEMLIDPWGNRLQSGPGLAVVDGQQQYTQEVVSYLVEGCDPCEAVTYAIDKVLVSDFITPNFYLTGTANLQYSYTGTVESPLDVLFGGYISWLGADNHIRQLTWFNGSAAQIADLGEADEAMSLREYVDRQVAIKRLASPAVPGQDA